MRTKCTSVLLEVPKYNSHVCFRVECCNFHVGCVCFFFKVYKATGEEFLKIAGGK